MLVSARFTYQDGGALYDAVLQRIGETCYLGGVMGNRTVSMPLSGELSELPAALIAEMAELFPEVAAGNVKGTR